MVCNADISLISSVSMPLSTWSCSAFVKNKVSDRVVICGNTERIVDVDVDVDVWKQ